VCLVSFLLAVDVALLTWVTGWLCPVGRVSGQEAGWVTHMGPPHLFPFARCRLPFVFAVVVRVRAGVRRPHPSSRGGARDWVGLVCRVRVRVRGAVVRGQSGGELAEGVGYSPGVPPSLRHSPCLLVGAGRSSVPFRGVVTWRSRLLGSWWVVSE
jgi:hypothetical protein